jgi:hypothetical protein
MSEEPEVTLLSGERVDEALFEWIMGLLGKGHVISLSEDDMYRSCREFTRT